MAVNRRRFFALTGLTALGVASRQAVSAPPQAAPSTPDGLDKPPLTGKRWAMIVDAAKCLKDESCDKCTQACHGTHNVPDLGNAEEEVKWIWKERYADVAAGDRYQSILAAVGLDDTSVAGLKIPALPF